MKRFYFLFLILLCLSSSHYLNSQCIDYPTIDGPICGSCLPSGWTPTYGSPDLRDPTSGSTPCYGNEYSPTGGTAIQLLTGWGEGEGAQTIINGLVTGTSYYLAFWYRSMECTLGGTFVFCCSSLEIIVDGNAYFYPTSYDWTLVEICVVASSSEMIIEVLGIDGAGADGGGVLVDEADCEMSFCCNMVESTFDFPLVYCETDAQFDLPDISLEDIPGTWDVNPFNPGMYGGERVDIVFTPDDSCHPIAELEIRVQDFLVPYFDIPSNYCPSSQEFLELPLVSDNGIDGVWNMPFLDLIDYEGETIEMIFYPDDLYCTVGFQIEIDIDEVFETEFELDESYCQQDSLLALQNIDMDGATGTWSVNPIDLEQGTGIYQTTFTPDSNLPYCYSEYIYSYQITDAIDVLLDLDTIYCRSNSLIALDTFSVDSILGTWSIQRFRTDTISGNEFTSLFSSLPGQADCISETIVTFHIIDPIAPSFVLPQSICTSDSAYTLPEYSLVNSIHGTWSLPTIDPALLGAMVVTSTFIPDDTICALSFIYELTINPAGVPEFDTPNSLCNSAQAITLPDVSKNGFSGNWNINPIDPSTISSNVVQTTFVPDEPCAEEVILEIIITTNITPEFDLPDYLCHSDSRLVLPTISTNGIIGSWSEPFIDPPNHLNSNVTTIFTPDDTSCTSDLDITIWVQGPSNMTHSATDPSDCFTQNGSISFSTINDNLEFSLDNITWQDSSFVQLSPGSYTVSIRDSNYVSCIDSLVITLSAPSAPEIIDVEAIDILSCELLMGSITVQASGIDIEYSIDGITWQDSNVFELLDDGDYTVLIREKGNPDCGASSITTITRTQAPEIILVLNTSSTSCVTGNGLLEIVATGTDLEYSIDGINWQEDPLITELDAGTYEVFVREKNSTDCFISTMETVIGVMIPSLELIPTDPSSCGEEDGSILVMATGINLEYSIDSGITWTPSLAFTGLPAGDYMISAREISMQDCIITKQVSLNVLDAPIINEVLPTNPSKCLQPNGLIEIIATGIDLEYSIDGGISWSGDSLFELLTDGQYFVVVREKALPDCFSTTTVSLAALEDVIIQVVITNSPSACAPLTGMIEVIAIGMDLEYSIDGGNTFQDSNVFDEVESGEYMIVVRNKAATDCSDEDQVELILIQDQLPAPDIAITPISECDTNDGMAFITIDTIGVLFSIDGGIDWQSSNSFNNLGPGDYTILVVIDVNENCTNEISFSLAEPECDCSDLEVQVNTSPVFCLDQNNGMIDLQNIAGYETGINLTTWSNGNTGPTISELSSGWYAYTITYDTDCEWIDSAYVEEIDPLTFGLKAFDPDCAGLDDGSIEVTEILGGNGDLSFSTNGVDYQDENIFYDLSPQEYLVYVLDQENCLETSLISINEGLILSLELPEIQQIEAGDSIYLNPLIDGATIDSFAWTPQLGILNPGELVALVQPDVTTEYVLEVFFGDCIEIRRIRIDVGRELPDIYVPNIFLSDQNNSDNRFYVQGNETQIRITYMAIYDRWGNKVFYADNPSLNQPMDGWDGNIGNQKAMQGVYVYLIEYTVDEQAVRKAGDITLFR